MLTSGRAKLTCQGLVGHVAAWQRDNMPFTGHVIGGCPSWCATNTSGSLCCQLWLLQLLQQCLEAMQAGEFRIGAHARCPLTCQPTERGLTTGACEAQYRDRCPVNRPCRLAVDMASCCMPLSMLIARLRPCGDHAVCGPRQSRLRKVASQRQGQSACGGAV